MDGKLGCIEIFDNDKYEYTEERTETLPVRLAIFDAEGNREEILPRKSETSDEDLLEELGKSIFYTIGTNYSLYTNSVVRFDYDESQEDWMNTIYHKNDGYFTPIVLVPYRNYNGKNSIIDTEKELRLANERVNTLAILLKASDGSAFIEGFLPEKAVYELKNERSYREEIKDKIEKLWTDDYKKNYDDFDETVTKLKDFIGGEWKKLFEIKKILGTASSDLKNEEIKKIVFNNIICYLSYKTIKICFYYDRYKKVFKENGKNVFDAYITNKEGCKRKIKDIISNIYNDTEPPDFINLKIRQCVDFLRNGVFYLTKTSDKYEIPIENVIEEINKKGEKNLTYDSVFLKLLPPIFKKKYVYKKIGSDDEMTISQMSSGEQQLLYSLSYAVYHMKNAASNQFQLKKGNNLISIPYKNMNLIFDEAELYYHPEYQRQFIDKLLGILKRSHFEKDIDSINITIVTHSPFMLSDIPNSNILALEDGKRDISFKGKTLGANIYDLLSNQFFMKSAIGAYVEKVINKIIDDYNEFKRTDREINKNCESKKELIKDLMEKYDNQDGKNFYVKFAQEIGDEYLRDVIQDMILQMQNKDYREREIESYKKKLEQLENKK